MRVSLTQWLAALSAVDLHNMYSSTAATALTVQCWSTKPMISVSPGAESDPWSVVM